MSSQWQRWQKLLPVNSAILLGLAIEVLSPAPVQAQIVPDDTLGTEGSRLTEADRIEGGAQRGANLFHSFSDFNVGAGQSVYFADPAGIQTIFSRVTGSNASKILGTLGVDGTASLYFLNPNGIIFGPNAQLDISGAFVASTADEFLLGDGASFSAVNPTAPPLLNVTITPGLQYGAIQPGTTITNQGQLVAGQDLTLAADILNLQGELWAGEDLTLIAQDTLQIRDSIANPFVAAAGEQLLLQGNQAVDIFALNHPNSGLVAGGNLILRSAQPVIGDAHYWNGGTFRIEQTDGSPNNLISIEDPIIRSQGDVSFAGYQGGSLHILAAGAVDIGTVIITGTDTAGGSINPTTTPELASVELSNGNTVVVDGTFSPTLDVRAGMNPEAIGTPLGTVGDNFPQDFFLNIDGSLADSPANSEDATSADITIDEIFFSAPAGLLLLTNQYEPNLSLAGGDIQLEYIATNEPPYLEDSGSVIVDSRHDITSPVGEIYIYSVSFSGESGDITLIAEDTISLDGGIVLSQTRGEEKSGDILVQAETLSLQAGGSIGTITLGAGVNGDLTIQTFDSVQIDGESADGSVASGLFTQTLGGIDGEDSGNLQLRTSQLIVSNGGQISTSTAGNSNAGDLTIQASNTVQVSGSSSFGPFPSGIFTETYSSGTAGTLHILTPRLQLLNGGQISTGTSGEGNGGNLLIEATDLVEVSGAANGQPSGLFTQADSLGDAGEELRIQTRRLVVSDGGLISAATFGQSQGGNIIIEALGSVQLTGNSLITSLTIGSQNAGDIAVRTPQLFLTDGGSISTTTSGAGQGGNLIIEDAQLIEIVGTTADGLLPSGLFSEARDTGSAGEELRVSTSRLVIAEGAQISAGTVAQGRGGNLIIEAEESILLSGSSATGEFSSGLFTESTGTGTPGATLNVATNDLSILDGARISASSSGAQAASRIDIAAEKVQLNAGAVLSQSASGNGGNLNLQIGDLILLNNNSRISTSAGTAEAGGDGGNIAINAPSGFLVGVEDTDSDIVAQAFEGSGGNIDIVAQGIYGLVQRRAIAGNGTNDIDASSQFGQSGTVTINDPTVDPSGASVELPAEVINAADLVDRSCQADAGQGQSRLVVTGRGGLPPNPANIVRSEGAVVIAPGFNEDNPPPTSLTSPTSPTSLISSTSPTSPTPPPPEQITEAHTWQRNESGQVVLLAAQNGSYRIENTTPFSCQESPVEGAYNRGMP